MRSLLLLQEDQALGCFAKKSVIFFWKSAFLKSSLLIVHRCSRIWNLPAIHSMTSSKFLKVKGFCRMAFLKFSLTRGMKVTSYNPSAAIASRMFSMHAHTGKGFKPLLDFGRRKNQEFKPRFESRRPHQTLLWFQRVSRGCYNECLERLTEASL